MKGFLLDTHVWLWFMLGDVKLTPKLRKLINNSIEENTLWLASISIWEIGMLANKNKITLAQPCLDWVQEALAGLNLAELTPQVTIDSCHLPDDFHGDPADRIIVATARNKNLSLITRDNNILIYAKKHYLNAIKA